MIKVLVDARIDSKKSGGIQQALVGFAEITKNFPPSEYEFAWLLSPLNKDFLDHVLPRGSTKLYPHLPNQGKTFMVNFLKKSRLGSYTIKKIKRCFFPQFQLPAMFSVVKRWNPDLIHFPTQFGFKTSLPNIYQPHDFQHFHLPSLFSKDVIRERELGFGQMIAQASRVIVGNEWTLEDFKNLYPVYAQIGLNIPAFPQPLELPARPESQFNTETKYLFYPASFWPHKNHDTLFRSLRILIDDGLNFELSLSGPNLSESKELRGLIRSYNLTEKVKILGYLTPSQLATTYRNAFALVMPSLFESESLPIWEAFMLRTPVIASKVTALPSQVAGAALLFDPKDAEDLAVKIKTLLGDTSLRSRLISNGSQRLSELTLGNSALGYRYAYRRALNFDYDNHDFEWIKNGFRF